MNPSIDFVYKFELPPLSDSSKRFELMRGHRCLNSLPEDTGKGVYIAGSSAVKLLKQYIITNAFPKWECSDVDFFYTGCQKSTRMCSSPPGTDFIFCKEKTIEEVLLNFDLPCCRVGIDFKFNLYASIQALFAMFTGKTYLPLFMKTPKTFINKLKEYQTTENKPDGWDYNTVMKIEDSP